MNTNLRQLFGNWNEGYALDKHMQHSEFLGEDERGHPRFASTRSQVGEALYQLKYKRDQSQVAGLAQAVVANICPKFPRFGLIIPMPASNPRAVQPVDLLAQAIGQAMGVPVFGNILTKTANGTQLKDLQSKADKQAALANSFTLHEVIKNEGKWDALIVDDLFHTGASMEAAVVELQKYSKINNIYVTALSWR